MPPSGAATNAEPSTTRKPSSTAVMSGLLGRERDAERGPTLEPRARAVARIGVERLQALDDREHGRGAERVAPGERPHRIAEAERNREVDVARAGDALLGDVAGEIDDHGDDALGDETRA